MPTETPIRETSSTTYRISGGKIRKGAGDGDTILDAISGHLLGFDYIEGVNDDNEDYAAIRAELELASGEKVKVRCKVGLEKSNSNVSACGFALGLLKCELMDDIAIFPKLGNPDPKYGKCPTFVNLGKFNPATGKYADVKTNRDEFPGVNSKEKLPHVIESLKKHSAYRDLSPKKEGDLSIFSEIAEEGKWADPFGEAKPVYLEAIGKVGESTYADYSDIPGDILAKFAEVYRTNKDSQPKALAKFAPAKKNEMDDYDPFSDI